MQTTRATTLLRDPSAWSKLDPELSIFASEVSASASAYSTSD